METGGKRSAVKDKKDEMSEQKDGDTMKGELRGRSTLLK